MPGSCRLVGLPAELLTLIIENCCSDDDSKGTMQTLRALSLVCHDLNEVVAPYLYHSVLVKSPGKTQRFLYAITGRPAYAELVRHLHINLGVNERFPPDLKILGTFSNIQTLKLIGYAANQFMAYEGLTGKWDTFPFLEKCGIHQIGSSRLLLRNLLPIWTAPNLKTLVMEGTRMVFAKHQPSAVPALAALDHVEFRRCDVGLTVLRKLLSLRSAPSLAFIEPRRAGSPKILQLLAPHVEALVYLAEDPLQRRPDIPQHASKCLDFKAFERLRYLEIHAFQLPRNLGGWAPGFSGYDIELPPNLKHLVLQVHVCEIDPTKLLPYLTEAARHRQHLNLNVSTLTLRLPLPTFSGYLRLADFLAGHSGMRHELLQIYNQWAYISQHRGAYLAFQNLDTACRQSGVRLIMESSI